VDENIKPIPNRVLLDRINFLLKDSTIYGLAGAAGKSISLITLPVLARHLSVEEYGVLDYCYVASNLLSIVIVFGQDSAVARFIFEYDEIRVRRQIVSQSLALQLLGIFLLLPVLYINGDALLFNVISTDRKDSLLLIILLQVPFLVLINFSQNLLKWNFKRTKFLILSIGSTLLQAVCVTVSVLAFNADLQRILITNLVVTAGFSILGMLFVRDWITLPSNFWHVLKTLPFAAPCGIICLFGSFAPMFERNLTHKILGASDLGLYAVATKLALIIAVFANAFQTSWGPFSLKLHKETDAVKTYNWVLKFFSLIACITALITALLAGRLIPFLVTDRYNGAAVCVFPLAMSFVVQSVGWIIEIGINISKRSYLGIYSYAVSILITWFGILTFGQIFGLIGVGLGVLSGQMAKVCLSSFLAQKVYPLQWKYNPSILIIMTTLAFGLLANCLALKCGSIASDLALIIGLVLIVGLGWKKLLESSERNEVILFVNKKVLSRKYLK
jgi:O-antigen/teichoic acid export membrane protein